MKKKYPFLCLNLRPHADESSAHFLWNASSKNGAKKIVGVSKIAPWGSDIFLVRAKKSFR